MRLVTSNPDGMGLVYKMSKATHAATHYGSTLVSQPQPSPRLQLPCTLFWKRWAFGARTNRVMSPAQAEIQLIHELCTVVELSTSLCGLVLDVCLWTVALPPVTCVCDCVCDCRWWVCMQPLIWPHYLVLISVSKMVNAYWLTRFFCT